CGAPGRNHERLGSTILTDRSKQHDEVGGQVLGAGEGAGQHGATVVLQDSCSSVTALAEPTEKVRDHLDPSLHRAPREAAAALPCSSPAEPGGALGPRFSPERSR